MSVVNKEIDDKLPYIRIFGIFILVGMFLAVISSCRLAKEMSIESMEKNPNNLILKVRRVDGNGVWRLVPDPN